MEDAGAPEDVSKLPGIRNDVESSNPSHLSGVVMNSEEPDKVEKDLPACASSALGNGADQSASLESASGDGDHPAVEPTSPSAPSDIPARNATGPRTVRGKLVSSRNATKHGIFSSVVLKEHESRTRYRLVSAQLRDYFKPEGIMEELLVEQIAIFLWRRNRLLQAERAEIEKGWILLRDSTWTEQIEKAQDMEKMQFGMVGKRPNSFALRRILTLLGELRANVESRGFDEEDFDILRTLYGPGDSRGVPDGLFTYYVWSQKSAELYAEEGGKQGGVPLEEAKRTMIDYIDQEIKRLTKLQKWVKDREIQLLNYDERSTLVPSDAVLERLLKYESHLSREFERTLNQLERLQRMRLGHPAPPEIKVNVST